MKKSTIKRSITILSVLVAVSLAGCGNSTPQEKIQKVTGVTQQQAAETFDILKSTGISGEFEEIKKFDKKSDTYEFNDKTYGTIYFSVVNGKLNDIANSSGIYIYKDGNKTNDLNEVTFKSGEESEFVVAARKAVKDRLKAPSSADFSEDYARKVKDEVIYSGKVEAQNSFGAKMQHGVIVIMDYNTKEVKSVDFM